MSGTPNDKQPAQKRSVLLIDDNPRQRQAVAGLLRYKGHECLEAENQFAAIEFLVQRNGAIDVCLLDWYLENEDGGKEALRAIREMYPRIPVLVFTASDDAGSEAYAAGATLYVPKPFEPAFVIHFVEALIVLSDLVHEVDITARQRDLLQRANEFLQHLHRWASQQPNQSPEEIADDVAGSLHEQFKYARVRIYLINGGLPTGTAARGMHHGFDIRRYSLANDDPNAKNAFEKGSPIIIPAVELEHDRFFREFQKDGVHFQWMVPLISAFGKVGLISIDNKGSARELTDDDMAVMPLVSAAIADAIEAARHRRLREREGAWYRALLQIDHALTTTPSVDKVLQAIVDTLTLHVHADLGIVMTRRGERLPLRVDAVSSGVDPRIYKVVHDGTYGLIGRCLSTGKHVVEENVLENAEFMQSLSQIRSAELWRACFSNTKKVVIEPVLCGHVQIGVLILGFSVTDSLDELDLRFLDDVAGRVAIALANLDQVQRFEAGMIQRAKLSDLALLMCGVSHGIRNPLQTARIALENIQQELSTIDATVDLKTGISDSLSKAQESLTCAFEFINRLVRWATPQSASAVPIRIDGILRDLAELASAELRNRKVDLVLSLPADIPTLNVSIDGLRVAFDDLLWNATQAMPQGGTLTISIEVDRSAGNLVVAFADTGIGMSHEQVERLLSRSPFQPLPAGGAGLGLYFARTVVTSVGGSIECSTREGQGTTFTLNFPIAAANSAPGATR